MLLILLWNCARVNAMPSIPSGTIWPLMISMGCLGVLVQISITSVCINDGRYTRSRTKGKKRKKKKTGTDKETTLKLDKAPDFESAVRGAAKHFPKSSIIPGHALSPLRHTETEHRVGGCQATAYTVKGVDDQNVRLDSGATWTYSTRYYSISTECSCHGSQGRLN